MNKIEQTIQKQMDVLNNSIDSLELKAKEWVIIDIENIAVGRLLIRVRETGICEKTGKVRYGLFKGDTPFNFIYKCFNYVGGFNSSLNDLFYEHHRVYSKEECLDALKVFMRENPTYFNIWEPRKRVEMPNYRWDSDEWNGL